MKKILTFIPIGVGISSAIIYVFNVIQFRMINNSATMLEILSNLRIYLYVSIISFLVYLFIKIIILLNGKIKLTKEFSNDNKEEYIIEKNKEYKVKEKAEIKEIIITGNKYCRVCSEKIFDTDTYCKNCGSYQKDKKSGISPLVRNIINVLQIVILILILYFLVNMLFDFKEKKDPNFKSPFKVSMTK